ncbi:glucan phosphoethanolaminetransferase (alkaline phosphatase superfamily) [Bacillus fengqiuensis]|nr:glucan phosphoethanolaminetransferase (alkaline phosphatase superfamily) [Bacillus fengqiuensis]
MKKQSVFFGIMLVGLSLFLLMSRFQFPLMLKLHSWPSLLVLVGAAMIVQAYKAHDFQQLLPGMILLTLGIHFHAVSLFFFWPKHIGMVLLIIALSFLLSSRKSHFGLLQGIFLFSLSMLMMFSDRLKMWTALLEQHFNYVWKFWPLLLLIIGLYLLFFKRK